MMIRFNRTLSILCAVALLICAVSTWAYAEQTPATPSDLTPVEEAPVTEQTEEEPAESVEVIITKTLGINQSWEGRMKKTKPAVLKLDLSSPGTVYMLVEGQDVWATVEKSDRLTADPTRYLTNSETDQLIYSWEAEAGSYLITLGPVEPNLLAMATVTFMDTATYEEWEAEQEDDELESKTNEEKEHEAQFEPENEMEVDQSTEIGKESQAELDINSDEVYESERSVSIQLTWDYDPPLVGDIAHFTSELIGYDNMHYSLQWQTSWDKEIWTDYEGATEKNLDVAITAELKGVYWRLMVYVETNE